MEQTQTPDLKGLLEATLFVEDLGTARAFYEKTLGLKVFDLSEAACGFVVGEAQLLLLITREKARRPSQTPGGEVPPCLLGPGGAGGAGHIALAIDASEFDVWRTRLECQGIEILSEVTWERGGRSLYFRDPDGHLLELATPGVWDVY